METNGNDFGNGIKSIDVSGLYTQNNEGMKEIKNTSIGNDSIGIQEDLVIHDMDLNSNRILKEDVNTIQEANASEVISEPVGLDLGEIHISEDIEQLSLDESIRADVAREASVFSNIDAKKEKEYKNKKINKHFRKNADLVEEVEEEDLPIIEMYRVYKSYQPGVDAVKNINFRIKKGEFVFIVGKSGSGKTTLMNLMMNSIRPSSGRVYVNGFELTRLQRRKIPKFRRGIGVVFQDFKLLGDRDVFENIAFAQRVIEKTTRQVNKNVPEVLSLVGLMDKQKSLPSELSGGEQQRVAIARALVNQPTILLADEPTGNLDPKTAWEIMELLEEINRRGTTVIIVTHNLEIVNAMKKRVITIDNGDIVEDGIKGDSAYEIQNV